MFIGLFHKFWIPCKWACPTTPTTMGPNLFFNLNLPKWQNKKLNLSNESNFQFWTSFPQRDDKLCAIGLLDTSHAYLRIFAWTQAAYFLISKYWETIFFYENENFKISENFSFFIQKSLVVRSCSRKIKMNNKYQFYLFLKRNRLENERQSHAIRQVA